MKDERPPIKQISKDRHNPFSEAKTIIHREGKNVGSRGIGEAPAEMFGSENSRRYHLI